MVGKLLAEAAIRKAHGSDMGYSYVLCCRKACRLASESDACGQCLKFGNEVVAE